MIHKIKTLIHHHFTKAELTLEEIAIIIVACTMVALGTWAAEALLPVQINIVRCVTQEERIKMCNERSLCCDYIDEAKEGTLSRSPKTHDSIEDIQGDLE